MRLTRLVVPTGRVRRAAAQSDPGADPAGHPGHPWASPVAEFGGTRRIQRHADFAANLEVDQEADRVLEPLVKHFSNLRQGLSGSMKFRIHPNSNYWCNRDVRTLEMSSFGFDFLSFGLNFSTCRLLCVVFVAWRCPNPLGSVCSGVLIQDSHI